VKIVVLGTAGVGKSSIIHRYCKDQYIKDMKSTIGIDFFTKKETIRDTGQIMHL
jgi:GTPase SAR1 family protein